MVLVVITRTRLYGVHEAKILEGEHKNRSAALIVDPNNNRRLLYNGLLVQAEIVRSQGQHIDLLLK